MAVDAKRIQFLIIAKTILSAFLLFTVEFHQASLLLPTLGGGFQVWMISSLFYTFSLFISIVIFQKIKHALSLKQLLLLDLSFLSIGLVSFIIFNDYQRFIQNQNFDILINLLLKLLPMFLSLGMTVALAQQLWESKLVKTNLAIYSYSNIGSFSALFFFPLLFTPVLGKSIQYYFILAALFILILVNLLIMTAKSMNSPSQKIERFLWNRIKFVWVFLTFTSTTLMYAVTNYISMGIGQLPIVWIIPLGIYLLSFALIFREKERSLASMVNKIVIFWFGLNMIYVFSPDKTPLAIVYLNYYLFLFISCMILHHRLYELRPKTNDNDSISFYLSINLGGLLSSIVVTLIVPLIPLGPYNLYLEFFIGLILMALFLIFKDTDRLKKAFQFKDGIQSFSPLLFVIGVISIIVLYLLQGFKSQDIYYSRNFYGINIVEVVKGVKYIVNGRTRHGGQHISPELERFPLTYYHPKAPIADVFKTKEMTDVAIIGVGAGSLLFYSQPEQNWDMYEIDPDIIKISNEYFSFYKSSPANIRNIIGDGRVEIGKRDKKYDVIVLDAFSSDSIPTHLLTIEAFNTYQKKLKDDGILVIHSSNNLIKLIKLISTQSHHVHLTMIAKAYGGEDKLGKTFSEWSILSHNLDYLHKLKEMNWKLINDTKSTLWTDDKVNIFPYLKWQ